MEQFKEKYRHIKGKIDSLYVYVLYACSQNTIQEHIKKQLEYIDKVNDSYKRKLFSSRYFLLRDTLTNQNNPENHNYNNIIFVGDDINIYHLEDSQIQLLKKYNHQLITYKYDDHFDLDFLEDLILNDSPYHMYRINNNKIDYLQLTRTKKNTIQSKESKNLDVTEFISNTLPVNEMCIICGLSGKLKGLIDQRVYGILEKQLKDDEIMLLIDRIDQENILKQLSDDLLMIHDSKQTHKVIFKNHIQDKIKNGQLSKLYIDTSIHQRFVENMKKINQDINFKIIVINTKIKSFVDLREHTLDQYGGVIGISYY